MAHYDIPTLWSLRPRAHININNFTDEAFHYSLLRRHKPRRSVSSGQPINPSSRLSSFSQRSENASVLDGHLSYPTRLPKDPPGSNSAQNNTGFARFLEHHTSPKHQRVTAGGRIIPMEPPGTPVPVPKFPLRMHDRREDEDDLRASISDEQENVPQASSLATASLPNLPILNPLDPGILEQSGQLGLTGIPQIATSNVTGFVQQPVLHWALDASQQALHPEQQSQNMDVTVLPDRSAYGFSQEEFAWLSSLYPAAQAQNRIVTTQSHAQQQHFPVPTQLEATAPTNVSTGSLLGSSQLPPAFDPNPYLVPQWQYGGGLAPLLNNQPPIVPTAYKEAPHQNRLLHAQKQHEILTAQLSRIDRHMALHTWDLDPQSKKLLVEQRKSLVRELDAVRLYIEQLETLSLTARMDSSSDRTPVALNTSTLGATYVPGSFAASQPLLAPQPPASSSVYGMQPLPAPLPNIVSAFTSTEGSGDTTLSWQGVEHADCRYEDSNRTETPTGYETSKTLPIAPSMAKAAPPKLNLQVPTHAEIPDEEKNDLQWATPTKSSPSDLRKLYNKIEEANKRGDRIDDLLKELSIFTTEMLRQRRDELKISSQRGSVGEKSTHVTRGADELTGENAHQRRYGRRPWAPEFFPRVHSKIQRDPSSVGTEVDASNVSSSRMSTTDSWDSLHETKKPWLDRGSLKGEVKGPSSTDTWESPNEPFASAISSMEGSVLKHPGMPHWPLGSSDKSAGRPGFVAFRPIYVAASSNASQSPKQSYPLFFTRQLNKEPGRVSQKTAALAVPQNVTAQGFMPPVEKTTDSSARHPKQHPSYEPQPSGKQPDKKPWFLR